MFNNFQLNGHINLKWIYKERLKVFVLLINGNLIKCQ